MPRNNKGKNNPAYKHGFAVRSGHRGEYYSWCNMRRRCYEKTNNRYQYYGARGIKVCERWRNSFTDFLLDMGERPSKDYSIDRLDTDKDYTPSNCRWATRLEQARTRSNTLNYGGKSLRQKCAELGLNYKAIWAKKKRGEDLFPFLGVTNG